MTKPTMKRDAEKRVVRAAMRVHRFRLRVGGFTSLIQLVKGRILLDSMDRACALHARAKRRRR